MSIIKLPNVDELIDKYKLEEVTSPDIFYGKFKKYHPKGLFSEEIFGIEGSITRRTRMAYIDLKTKLIHPYIYSLIKKSSKSLLKGLLGHKQIDVVQNSKGVYEIKEVQVGVTGIDLFKKIIQYADKIKNLNEKLRSIILTYNKDENVLMIDKLLVIPPAYRPIIYINNKPILDPINEVYSKLIFNAQKNTDDVFGLGSNFVMLQEILWTLNEELYKSLSKKSGMIRTYMLGKRADFTGRAVISADPTLPVDTVAVPYKILARIAEPFIIHILMTGYLESGEFIPDMLKTKFKIPVTRSSLHTILKKYSKGLITDEQLNKLIESAIDIAVADKVVLIKRDPALHRMSWQAVNVVPTKDETIHLPSLLCPPLNADFDGDSVAGCNISLYTKSDNGYELYKTVLIDNLLELE